MAKIDILLKTKTFFIIVIIKNIYSRQKHYTGTFLRRI